MMAAAMKWAEMFKSRGILFEIVECNGLVV